MLRATWKALRPLLTSRARLAVAQLAVVSFLAGALEAVALVLAVNVALVIAQERDFSEIELPLVGELQLETSTMLWMAALAGVAVLLAHVVAGRLTARLSAGVAHRARERAIRAFSQSSWEHQSAAREGELQESVGNLAMQTAQLVITFGNGVASSLGLATLVAAAFVLDPVITLVVLVFGAFVFAILRPVTLLTRRQAGQFVEQSSHFSEEVGQWTSLAMELKVFGVDRAEADRLSVSNRLTARALLRMRTTGRIGSYLYRDLALLFLVGAVAVLYAIATDVDLAGVGAVVLLVVRALAFAQEAHAASQLLGEQLPNTSLLLERIESLERAGETFGTTTVDDIESIELRGVTYEYEPSRPAVTDVTLTIERGDALGVIGSSGAGKSTLVQVLLRLRRPTRGTVTVSGVSYEDIAPESWHRLVAFVPQEPRLYEGTVADNVAFLRSGIDRATVERSLAAAHVLDDVLALPDGVDTRLGPRGTGLSGGQRQRVTIARALAGAPQLLVLDEPTSALDVRSEQLFRRTIEELKGSVTMVLIAHRLSTVAVCDRVLALESGRIQHVGTLEDAAAAADFIDVGPDDP